MMVMMAVMPVPHHALMLLFGHHLVDLRIEGMNVRHRLVGLLTGLIGARLRPLRGGACRLCGRHGGIGGGLRVFHRLPRGAAAEQQADANQYDQRAL